MKTFIHTINVISESEPEKDGYLSHSVSKGERYRSIYNFNKPEKLMLYSDFADRCKTVFDGLKKPYINRIDVAWDSEDKQFFNEHKKYYRYLLTAFMLAYKSRNSFNVKDLLSNDDKSYWVKCNYFEATYYNKGLQIDGKSEGERTQARFEMRYKRLIVDDFFALREMIVKQTENRFLKALNYLEQVQMQYNEFLVECYRKGNIKKISELILLYEDRIFSKNQLVSLLKQLDTSDTNKEKKANNLISRYEIKLISENDMQKFIEKLIRDMQEFLILPSQM